MVMLDEDLHAMLVIMIMFNWFVLGFEGKLDFLLLDY